MIIFEKLPIHALLHLVYDLWNLSVQVEICDQYSRWWLSLNYRADSSFAPNQWEPLLFCIVVSHWLGSSLETALELHIAEMAKKSNLVRESSLEI